MFFCEYNKCSYFLDSFNSSPSRKIQPLHSHIDNAFSSFLDKPVLIYNKFALMCATERVQFLIIFFFHNIGVVTKGHCLKRQFSYSSGLLRYKVKSIFKVHIICNGIADDLDIGFLLQCFQRIFVKSMRRCEEYFRFNSVFRRICMPARIFSLTFQRHPQIRCDH